MTNKILMLDLGAGWTDKEGTRVQSPERSQRVLYALCDAGYQVETCAVDDGRKFTDDILGVVAHISDVISYKAHQHPATQSILETINAYNRETDLPYPVFMYTGGFFDPNVLDIAQIKQHLTREWASQGLAEMYGPDGGNIQRVGKFAAFDSFHGKDEELEYMIRHFRKYLQ